MNMKTTKNNKAKVISTVSEDCGVWLDAAELRTKKKKQVTRPISKLLNPLARSGGYSMAVALNFTQTKMHMPATKQSTISSFFQPQSKMSKDDCSFSHPDQDNQDYDGSFTPHSELHRTKRKRKVTNELPFEPYKVTHNSSQVYPQEFNADCEEDPDEACIDQKKEQDFFHLMWGYQSEEPEPAEKRLYEDVGTETGKETQKESNGGRIHRCGTVAEIEDIPETMFPLDEVQQDSNENYHQVHHKPILRANKSSSQDCQNEENLRAHDIRENNISIQRPVLNAKPVTHNQHIVKQPSEQAHHYCQWSPVKRNDKENSGIASSSHKTTRISPRKLILSHSPAKPFSHFEKPSVGKVQHYHSPKKSVSDSLENEQDSFAMLFTQDSEGFRVIANRSKQKRRPLKDQTNWTENRDNWDLSSRKSLEREDDFDLEPEMLFTQDSQGNMVIKH